jgi:hypothetical protein
MVPKKVVGFRCPLP